MLDYWAFGLNGRGFVLYVNEPLDRWWIFSPIGRFLCANYGLLGGSR